MTTRLVLKISTFAEDANGNEVFLSAGTQVWDISDEGPNTGLHMRHFLDPDSGANSPFIEPAGWNVAFRVHHPGVTAYEEVVTMDAVKLLRCLEGK